MFVTVDTAATLSRVGNIGAVLQHYLDHNPQVTHEIFCERAGMSTATLSHWLKQNTTRGMKSDTFNKLARGMEMTPAELKSILRTDSGAARVQRALSSYVMDPDRWLLKLAALLRTHTPEAKALVESIDKVQDDDGK